MVKKKYSLIPMNLLGEKLNENIVIFTSILSLSIFLGWTKAEVNIAIKKGYYNKRPLMKRIYIKELSYIYILLAFRF
jgi:hypothetical protein